jgi:hypothetical protein
MSPELLSAHLSMAMGAALVAALVGLFARLREKTLSPDASYGLAALGLIVFLCESAMGARLINHDLAMWAYLAAAALVTGVFMLNGLTSRLFFALAPLLATAYLFAPATAWRSPLTLPLFIWSLFSAIGFVRGEEPTPVVDARYPGRLPLRRPKRMRGVRELALAAIAAALALVFGADLFWPPPPPVEAPATQEEPVAPEAAEAPAESGANNEASAATPETYTARAGDSFKSIAKRLYGDASKARDIARANPDVKPSAKLRAGQNILLPIPTKKAQD